MNLEQSKFSILTKQDKKNYQFDPLKAITTKFVKKNCQIHQNIDPPQNENAKVLRQKKAVWVYHKGNEQNI